MAGPVSSFGARVSVWALSGGFVFVWSWVGGFVFVWLWILSRGGVRILVRGDGVVSGMKGLGEGGLLVNGDGRKGGGFGDQCIVSVSFFVCQWRVCYIWPAGNGGGFKEGKKTFFVSKVWWGKGW